MSGRGGEGREWWGWVGEAVGFRRGVCRRLM